MVMQRIYLAYLMLLCFDTYSVDCFAEDLVAVKSGGEVIVTRHYTAQYASNTYDYQLRVTYFISTQTYSRQWVGTSGTHGGASLFQKTSGGSWISQSYTYLTYYTGSVEYLLAGNSYLPFPPMGDLSGQPDGDISDIVRNHFVENPFDPDSLDNYVVDPNESVYRPQGNDLDLLGPDDGSVDRDTMKAAGLRDTAEFIGSMNEDCWSTYNYFQPSFGDPNSGYMYFLYRGADGKLVAYAKVAYVTNPETGWLDPAGEALPIDVPQEPPPEDPEYDSPPPDTDPIDQDGSPPDVPYDETDDTAELDALNRLNSNVIDGFDATNELQADLLAESRDSKEYLDTIDDSINRMDQNSQKSAEALLGELYNIRKEIVSKDLSVDVNVSGAGDTTIDFGEHPGFEEGWQADHGNNLSLDLDSDATSKYDSMNTGLDPLVDQFQPLTDLSIPDLDDYSVTISAGYGSQRQNFDVLLAADDADPVYGDIGTYRVIVRGCMLVLVSIGSLWWFINRLRDL